MDSLTEIAGLPRIIKIKDKEYKLSPLRLRDMVELSEKESLGESAFKNRAYQLQIHLRENEGLTLDDILDMELSDITLILDYIDKLFYADRKTKDEGNGNP